jgi:hypothetical protein
VGQTTLKATSSKVVKHEKTCSDNQNAFIPFDFDIFGFLALKASGEYAAWLAWASARAGPPILLFF